MAHSKLYLDNVSEFQRGSQKEQRLEVPSIGALIHEAQLPELRVFYSQMSDLLRETNDAQFGIVSQAVGDQWVRDATRAIPLAERMPHDAPVIEANNALMRCLSRLRPVDYAIEKKHHESNPELEIAIRNRLKNKFEEAARRILTSAQSDKSDEAKLEEIKKLEKEFNTSLIQGLHDANLTAGCESVDDAEKLLFHYRNLSSVLDPARTMVTLTYDDKAQVLQRETQYPVTKKTPQQKMALEGLRLVQPHPFKEERNGHNVRNIASQEADSLFVDLMLDDTRALPAQARKTHLVGTKNAFIVKNELIPVDDLPDSAALADYVADTDNTLWLARTGVPVYVGSGENRDSVQLHTRENLEQIRLAAEERMGRDELNLHVTCLNTYTPLENQKTMVDHLYEATRGQESGNDDITYAPTNPDGTFRLMDVAPQLVFDEDRPGHSLPLQKADRLDQVAKVVLAAAKDESTVSIVQCASGQDRTGTAVEKATQVWMRGRYALLGKDTTNIETMRAQGGNAAEITTHHVHGSPGMKKESMANNFFGSEAAFSKAASAQLYLSSAGTNKKNSVGAVDFLAHPGAAAKAQYDANLKEFEASLAAYKDTIGEDKTRQQFYDRGVVLLSNVKAIAAGNPDASELSDLNTVLVHSNTLLHQHDMDSPEFKESTRRLASMAQEVSGKPSVAWKALGVGLLGFACLALVTVGVLAAIPTGGASLLLTVAGATGLGLGVAAGIGAGVIAGSAASGATALTVGSEKGLAKSISNFKSALYDLREQEADDEPSNSPGMK